MTVLHMTVNGVDLAYVADGAGETVVFVHGASGDWRTWDAVRPYVSTRYRYVALSRRYHVPNAWPDSGERYTLEQHVDDVVQFIRGLDGGKVHLVGNSYGGRIAALVALQHPELLRSVVLGEPGLVAPDSQEGKAALAAWQHDLEKVDAAVESNDAAAAAIALFNAVLEDSTAFARAPEERRRRWLENARTVVALFRGPAAKPATCEEWRSLSVPTLVIGGEKSRASFRLGNDKLMTCLPASAARAVVPGGQHFYAATQPEATAGAILGFIARH